MTITIFLLILKKFYPWSKRANNGTFDVKKFSYDSVKIDSLINSLVKLIKKYNIEFL